MDYRFSRAVEAIYEAAPDLSRWPDALQAVANVFFDIGAVLVWQRDDGGFGVIASPGLAKAQKEYQEHGWYLRDTRSIRAIERALWLRSDAITERDFITDAEMATDPFYTDFLARNGLRWCAAIGIAPDPHVSVAISIQRSADKPPYSGTELETAARLGRHAEKALRLSIRLLDAELANLGLRDALSRIGMGVFALDALGRVVFSNPAGNALIGDDLTVVDGRLRVRRTAINVDIEAEIAAIIKGVQAAATSSPTPLIVHRRGSDRRPLVLYVLPISEPAALKDHFLTHVRAIVLIINPTSEEPAEPALVRDVLGITLGEARVAALVGSGLAPKAAADRLGIAEETARTALKRIYSKVGIARQSELTALLAKLVMR